MRKSRRSLRYWKKKLERREKSSRMTYMISGLLSPNMVVSATCKLMLDKYERRLDKIKRRVEELEGAND